MPVTGSSNDDVAKDGSPLEASELKEAVRQRDAARVARDAAESARNGAERARCLAEESLGESEHLVCDLVERVAFLEEQLANDRAYIAAMELQKFDSIAHANTQAALTQEIAILSEELGQRSHLEPS